LGDWLSDYISRFSYLNRHTANKILRVAYSYGNEVLQPEQSRSRLDIQLRTPQKVANPGGTATRPPGNHLGISQKVLR